MILSNVSLSAPSFAIGETGNITFTVKNTKSWTAKYIEAVLYGDSGNAFANYRKCVIVISGLDVSIAANVSKTYTRPFTVSYIDNPFSAARFLPAYLNVRLQQSGGWEAETDEGSIGTSALLIDKRYVPSIPIFTVSRSPNADSTGAAVDIACTLAEGADPEYEDLALTLKWKEEDAASFPAGNTLAVTVADALATNGTTVNPSYTFKVGKAYTLRATFTDGIDSAFSEIKLSKAEKTLNVHPTSKNIGLGQFAVADLDADDVKRLDMTYRPYFHEGIAALSHAHILEMLGVQTGETSTGGVPNGWKDVAVTFPTPYKSPPLIFIFPQTGDIKAANVGSNLLVLKEDTLSEDGFTARWYNNTSDTRYPKVRWIAIGELDT